MEFADEFQIIPKSVAGYNIFDATFNASKQLLLLLLNLLPLMLVFLLLSLISFLFHGFSPFF